MAKVFYTLRMFLVLCAICASTSGCLALEGYAVSQPVSETPNISVSKIGRIKIEEATIFISSNNKILIESGTEWFGIPFIPFVNKIHIQEPRSDSEYYGGEKESAYFLLEVFFAVHELPISFSLQDVVLKYRGKEWQPVGAYSLVKYWDTTQWWGHNLFWPLCANPEHKSLYVDDQRMITSNSGERMKRPSIHVSERMMLDSNTQHCFSIEFEMIKPDPRDEFNVEFSIRVNDKNIPIRIKYVPGTVRYRHAMQSDHLEKHVENHHFSDIGSLIG